MRHVAAYLRVWSVEFVSSAPASAFAPAGPISLAQRLQTRAKSDCQRLLTLLGSSSGSAACVYERLVKELTARLGKLAAYSSEVRVS